LWSLAFEFWFYVLYPVLLVLSVRLGATRATGVVATVSATALLVFLSGARLPEWILSVLTLWIVWAGGAWIADAYVGRVRVAPRRLGWAAVVAGATLVALATLANGSPAPVPVSDLLWGLGAGVLLAWMMLSLPRRLRRPTDRLARSLAPLGEISYSLYVVHVPWLVLLSAWWLSFHPRLPAGAELALPGAASALALAAGCWLLVERHFMASHPGSRLPGRLTRFPLSSGLPRAQADT
jgi:peptidoglycan/LPS O-acetylase OafA/YrhL